MAHSRAGAKIAFDTVMLAKRAIIAIIASAVWIYNANASNLASVYDLPPILSSCFTPLSPSATTRWVEDLTHEKILKNVSSFCDEGGLICDESIETPSAQLHKFSSYRLAKTKEYENMFFNESILSLGSLIKLPMKEPHIPTRAFLPPLLEPHLFNHSTLLFTHLSLFFGFHVDSPLATSMQETLQICNSLPSKGETKACVATFEDMVDFAKLSLGTIDMEVLTGAIMPYKQLATVVDLHEVTWDGQRVAVACHNAMFPFQVFYCHHIQGTKVYKVTLQTTISITTNISAVASCHPLDTSSHFSPSSPGIFQHDELLCHWNYGDNIIWIPMTNLSSPF